MLKICLVVPVYRSHRFLDRLFNSFNQSKVGKVFEWNICFVEDSPSQNFNWDYYLKSLEERNLNFKNIHLIKNKKNRGVTFSRNRAYLEIESDFFVFFDSDDEGEKNCLLNIEKTLIEMKENQSILLMATNVVDINQKTHQSNDYRALIRDYGKGERLVSVRFMNNAKPFFGSLRGHELSGLLNFSSKTNTGVKCSNICVRKYHNDNIHSLSNNKNFYKRAHLIIKGHLWTSLFLLKNLNLLWSTRFYLSFLYIKFHSLIRGYK